MVIESVDLFEHTEAVLTADTSFIFFHSIFTELTACLATVASLQNHYHTVILLPLPLANLWERQGLERLKAAAQRFGVQSKKVQARWSGGRVV